MKVKLLIETTGELSEDEDNLILSIPENLFDTEMQIQVEYN